MKDLKIEIVDSKGYKARSNTSLITIALITVAFSLIVAYISGVVYGLGFGVIIFAIQFFKSSRWDKYFILFISIDSRQIELVYDERGNKKTIKDDLSLFEFKKRSAFSRSRIIYLSIYYKKNLIIEQSEEGDWDEEKFNEVLEAVKP